jgi:hypothetical protein
MGFIPEPLATLRELIMFSIHGAVPCVFQVWILPHYPLEIDIIYSFCYTDGETEAYWIYQSGSSQDNWNQRKFNPGNWLYNDVSRESPASIDEATKRSGSQSRKPRQDLAVGFQGQSPGEAGRRHWRLRRMSAPASPPSIIQYLQCPYGLNSLRSQRA